MIVNGEQYRPLTEKIVQRPSFPYVDGIEYRYQVYQYCRDQIGAVVIIYWHFCAVEGQEIEYPSLDYSEPSGILLLEQDLTTRLRTDIMNLHNVSKHAFHFPC